jgi:hypothetical protein
MRQWIRCGRSGSGRYRVTRWRSWPWTAGPARRASSLREDRRPGNRDPPNSSRRVWQSLPVKRRSASRQQCARQQQARRRQAQVQRARQRWLQRGYRLQVQQPKEPMPAPRQPLSSVLRCAHVGPSQMSFLLSSRKARRLQTLRARKGLTFSKHFLQKLDLAY